FPSFIFFSLDVRRNLLVLSGGFESNLVLQEHVVVRRQTNQCLENVFNTGALTEECIDQRSTRRHEGRLEKITQRGEHCVEALKVVRIFAFDRDALKQFRQDDKINHQWCCEKRVFASVV